MKRFIAIVPLLILPTPAIAEDRLPTPDCHRQPSDPEWLRKSSNSTATSVLRSSPAPEWA